MVGARTQQAEMMTLAALAYTSATTRPSGESVADQEARILAGINGLLRSVAPTWQATWVGLTQDRANLAYIARSATAGAPRLIVGLRGTVLSVFDIIQDVDVTTTVPYAVGATTEGNLADGAMEAFTEVVLGTSLVAALSSFGDVGSLYVTGHSLGGAMVTTVAPYLAAELAVAQVVPYTFAAPTAGDADFASSFDQQFPSAQRVVNDYDVAPNAWADLLNLQNPLGFFPDTATSVTLGIIALVEVVEALIGPLPGYRQPTAQPPLNSDFAVHHASGEISSYQDWFAEAEFQHHTSTYLTLLGASPLPLAEPVVQSVLPACGPAAGGTSVTLTGTGFTSSSVVDFGVAPATAVSVDASGTTLSVVSPPGAGVVDVTVTTEFGTSSTTPGDRFAFIPN
ncbi:MAG: IPT/TIG domain-containing protein [Actinomycetota bacterium]|nr:IPT/TIG domain-containing protein [Actinomycetota bacterium]